MESNPRFSVGVDISKNDFHVNLLVQTGQTIAFESRGKRKFDNSVSGINAFHQWLLERCEKPSNGQVVMEATGVYHEELAYAMYDFGFTVCIPLANTIKHFALSLNEYSKTDPIDAHVIARMGIERALEHWEPFSPSIRVFKMLSRERQMLIDERTMVRNRLHSASFIKGILPRILTRYKNRVDFLNEQIEAIEQDMHEIKAADEQLRTNLDLLQTIPGVGFTTAAILLAETDGFRLFSNRSQLISFCGLDIVQHQSGSSVNGRTHISKKGNRRIRKALHMASLTAKNKSVFQSIFIRQLKRGKVKMQALVAVHRKLLLIAYAIVKSGETFDAERHTQHRLIRKPSKKEQTDTMTGLQLLQHT